MEEYNRTLANSMGRTSIDCNIGGVHVVDTSHTPRVLATSAALLRPPPVLHVRVRPTVVLRLLSCVGTRAWRGRGGGSSATVPSAKS